MEVINKKRAYVVRRYNDRRVWGPLNKPARSLKLCYYADTWDYHYNHYKPIFIGKKPTKITQKPKRPVRTRPKQNPKYFVDNIINLFCER